MESQAAGETYRAINVRSYGTFRISGNAIREQDQEDNIASQRNHKKDIPTL